MITSQSWAYLCFPSSSGSVSSVQMCVLNVLPEPISGFGVVLRLEGLVKGALLVLSVSNWC